MNIIKYYEKELNLTREANFLHQTSVSDTAPMHTHEFYEIFVVATGKAIHMVNGTITTIKLGDMILIRPSDVHYYDFYKSEDFSMFNFSFTEHLFNTISLLFPKSKVDELINSYLPITVKITPFEISEIMKVMTALDQSTESDENVRSKFRGYLAYLIGTYFTVNHENTTNKHVPSWLSNTVEEMKKIENLSIGLPKMIELSNVTQEHLSRELKKYYDTTPTEFINKQRLVYSIFLLDSTDKSVTNIAYECGFNNLSYFYKIFKEKYKITPHKFIDKFIQD